MGKNVLNSIPDLDRAIHKLVREKFGEIEVILGPAHIDVIASPMTRLKVKIAGIKKALMRSNAEIDSSMLVEAIFNALKQLQ